MFDAIFSIGAFLFKFLIPIPGYVAGVSSFPQPLTPEEEQDYLKRYRDGDEEARNVLIERNLRLVAHVVKKYNTFNMSNDDLISIGTIGLIKAISSFNFDKGTRLATYAARCIDNEILMTMRASKKLNSEISLQEPLGFDKEGNTITWNDVLGSDEEEVVEQLELKMQVKKLYNKMKTILLNREKYILELRYGLMNGTVRTQKEIAKMLGISRSYVSRIEKKAIGKLEKEMKA